MGRTLFGSPLTLARYKTGFYRLSAVSLGPAQFRNPEEVFRPLSSDHANRLASKLFAEYQLPPLDPAVGEELDAFLAKSREDGRAAA